MSFFANFAKSKTEKRINIERGYAKVINILRYDDKMIDMIYWGCLVASPSFSPKFCSANGRCDWERRKEVKKETFEGKTHSKQRRGRKKRKREEKKEKTEKGREGGKRKKKERNE